MMILKVYIELKKYFLFHKIFYWIWAKQTIFEKILQRGHLLRRPVLTRAML
jgi:hypothetical protein